MLTTDHVLGRPSSQFRKVQVFAVVSFWSFYLLRYVGSNGTRFVADHMPGARDMARHSFETYLLALPSASLPGNASS